MNNGVECIFSDVTERDMDMLLMEEFICSKRFLEIFTSLVGIIDSVVVSVQSSKTDASLGESDITVIVESNGEKIGLLIEDKIDAVAMPEQSIRYSLRGDKVSNAGISISILSSLLLRRNICYRIRKHKSIQIKSGMKRFYHISTVFMILVPCLRANRSNKPSKNKREDIRLKLILP